MWSVSGLGHTCRLFAMNFIVFPLGDEDNWLGDQQTVPLDKLNTCQMKGIIENIPDAVDSRLLLWNVIAAVARGKLLMFREVSVAFTDCWQLAKSPCLVCRIPLCNQA